MKYLNTILITTALFCYLTAFGQQNIVGTVSDSDGNPLPAVNVVIEGTTNGVSTNFDGQFSLQAQIGQSLVFSYLGFETQIVEINSYNINVILSESSSELDEVVIIGYGSTQRKDLTGAVDYLLADDFNKVANSSAQQLIQGKVSGVTVTSSGGAPGEGSNIRIRGTGSLNLDSNPLYVVDGIPFDSGGVGGSRNVLNIINSNDIESISVLKDASASAIYGSRAANGVVLITTKKSRSSKTKISFTQSGSVSKPVDFVNVLSADQFREGIISLGDSDYISRLGNYNTDWQSLIYKEASSVDTNLSINSNLYGVPVRVSVGRSDYEGILSGDEFFRNTASINLSPSFLDNSLRLNLSARVQQTENDFANRGAISSAVQFDPTKPVYDSSSPYAGYYTWMSNGRKLSLSPTNPLALLNLTDDTSEVERIIANAKIDYDIPFMDNLTATLSIGLDESEGVGVSYTDPLIPTDELGFNGSGSNYSNSTINEILEAYFNYQTDLSLFDVEITSGYSYQAFEYDNTSLNYKEVLNPDGTINEDNSVTRSFIDKSKNVLISYFGRANFDFSERLLLTMTLRADASSKLNPDDRWGYFPSFGLAWNLHNENFMSSDVVDQFKLRIGYGELGNVNGLGDYNFLTRYEISNDQASYSFGNSFYNTYRPAPINKDLKWEVAKTLNAGIDFSVFSGRFSGSINAYIKNTEDLIATAVTDPFTNFGSTISANIGDMENKGIEIDLSTIPIVSDDFNFEINYNVSFNDNTITRLNNDQRVGGISGGVGNTIQRHQEGKAPFSYHVYKQIYNAEGKPIEGAFADLNDDGIINEDDKYFYKDPFADINMGASLRMTYKNLDFSVSGRSSIGNYVYNNSASGANYMAATQLSRLDNQNASLIETGFLSYSDKSLISDHFIENASFLRIDNITLGYKINLEDDDFSLPVRLYFSLDNPHVITNYSGIDPEIFGGIDNNFYPRSKTISFGMDINL